MSKKFYIADMHFGHNNVITFDNRPFNSVEEMNQRMIENWNDRVSDNDTVYVLGDIFWKKQYCPILKELKGYKYLILGNHDQPTANDKEWNWVAPYAEIMDNDRHIVLSHYPIMFFNGMHRPNWYHLYGHIHNSQSHNMMENFAKQTSELMDSEYRGYNVGAMMPYMNYTPRTFDEIVDGAKQMRGETV